ncbi:3'-tRNA processing endoribonuclease [Balamuthia mandrillaris]
MMLPLYVHRKNKMEVYAPATAVPYLKEYVAAMNRLNQESSDWEDRSGGYHYHPISFPSSSSAATTKEEGEESETKGGSSIVHGFEKPVAMDKSHAVRFVRCTHAPVSSLGYCFSEVRQKLKGEFADKKGRELGLLRKQGVEIMETVNKPLFAFLGDTTEQVFAEHGEDVLRDYPVIFVECTFFIPGHEQAAQQSQHMHWSKLKPYVALLKDTTFILIHFSKRHSEEEILIFFEEQRKLAAESENAEEISVYSRVIPWIDPPRSSSSSSSASSSSSSSSN